MRCRPRWAGRPGDASGVPPRGLAERSARADAPARSARVGAMPVPVREVMDPKPVTVRSDTPVEDVIRLLGDSELPGVPVVEEDGRCVGIVTEADLVIADEQGDLHLPHYIELFGGVVFLEPLRHFGVVSRADVLEALAR